MTLASLSRTARTARHLRPSQVAWRVRYQVRRRLPARVPGVAPSPTCAGGFPDLARGEVNDALTEAELGDLERGAFTFLHHRMALGEGKLDWRLGRQDRHRLWVVALHSHRWAWQLARTVRVGGATGAWADVLLQDLLGRWIEECDLSEKGARDLAWNAYVVATRIRWWCCLYTELGEVRRRSWGELDQAFRRSLWKQAAYLAANLEFDLRANHLLRNAVGLVCAGRFFAGPRAEHWLAMGTRLAVAQVREQVLEDGGHFERSPMYHLHVMEDVRSIAGCVIREEPRRILREHWARMAAWAAWMTHPDGRIPLLNDAAHNGAPPPACLLEVGGRELDLTVSTPVRLGCRTFAATGMVVRHQADASLFFDVGAVGPDYQPGHAHADTLTIELSVCGQRLFVDPGVPHYDRGRERTEARSTAAHNTVCVDGANSSETWDIFRVGRRARVTALEVESNADGLRVSATHDGYLKTHGVGHTRDLNWSDPNRLAITDHLESKGSHAYCGGFLLDPGWTVVQQDASGWELTGPGGRVEVRVQGRQAVALATEARTCWPEFGVAQRTSRLCWSCRTVGGAEIDVQVLWRST